MMMVYNNTLFKKFRSDSSQEMGINDRASPG